MSIFVWPPVTLSTSSSPIEFTLDGADQAVTEDTGTPANNRPLPNKLFIQKDGVTLPINKDTGTPANTLGLPVEIVAASGTPINITAGDLNVQLTDLGANFDRTRIGDGTNQWNMNGSNEGLVHDASVLSKLTDIETTINDGISVTDAGAIAELQDIEAELVTVNAQLIDIENAITGGQSLRGVQNPVLVDTSTLSATPLLVATLVSDIKKFLVSNASGNNLILLVNSVQQCIIPKGANFNEISVKGQTGQAVELRTVSGAGTAGECSLSFLGV